MSKNKKSKSPVTGQEYQASSEPRYTGIPTFMRSPLATTLDDLEIALVGVFVFTIAFIAALVSVEELYGKNSTSNDKKSKPKPKK